jgi:ankyrin repeat protein
MLNYPLVTAFKTGNRPLINYLLQRNNLSQSHLNAALMNAISSIDPELDVNVVRRLLNKGANVNTKIIAPWTPLSYAIHSKKPSVIREILKRGPTKTRLALVTAITTGNVPLIKMFINAGIPVNQKMANIQMSNDAREVVNRARALQRKALATAALMNPLRNKGRSSRTNNVVQLPPNIFRRIIGFTGNIKTEI